MAPFLNEILRRIKGAVDVDSTQEDHIANSRKLSVFVGHSAVLQHALAALGLYRNICANPPFAARIVIEVWEKIENKSAELKVVGRAMTTDASSRLRGWSVRNNTTRRETEIDPDNQYIVRVLYDGTDMTNFVPGCSLECTLAKFKGFVSGLVEPWDALSDRCKEIYKKYIEEFDTRWTF